MKGIKMLTISFRPTDNTILDVDTYFNYNYEDVWLDDELVKQMILDIDNSKVISANCIESQVLGQIAPSLLSRGVKALILMYKEPQLELWATACGDNCADWILKIAEEQDITIVLEHIMQFKRDFKGYCITNKQAINSLDDYRKFAIELL